MKNVPAVLCTFAVCAFGLGVPSANAQIQHVGVVGIKPTVTNLDAGTLTADIDVTENILGVSPNTHSYIGTAHYPAVEWGDGATLYTATVPFVASGPTVQYRGSFSHTYPGTGPYTVTVHSTCCATISGTGTTTGNRIGPATGSGALLSNTTVVDFASVPVSRWQGLAALAALMLLAGLYLLRR